MADVHFIVPYTDLIPGCYFHTGCDELTVATDQQRHEDQDYSSPRDHCQCNDQGICVFCICFYAHSCNDPGPGLGGVEAFVGGDGGQEPRGQRRGQLQQRLYRGTHVPW